MEFSNIRFLAVVAVVVLHVSSLYMIPYYETPLSSDWLVANIFESMTRWCVPIFVIISGYFLLDKEESISHFFNKRASKIIIPIIFWSFFYILWVTFIQLRSGNEIGIKQIISPLIFGKPYYHLWYVFMIPFLYVFTPYLRKLLKIISKKEFFYLVLIVFSYEVINQFVSYFINPVKYNIFINTFFMYVGYFLAGGYLKIYGMPSIKNKYLVIGYVLSTAITAYGVYYFKNDYFYTYLSPTIVLQSFLIFFYLINNFKKNIAGMSEILASLSFGVYLVHPFFRDIVSHIIKPEFLHSILYIPTVSFLIIIISYIFCFIVDKVPHLRKII